MNTKQKKYGYSLVEVLIYIAILAIIGTILTGYFMVAINSEAEHNKRNDLAISVSNITSTIKYDLLKANRIGEPLLNMSTSTYLEIMSDGNLIKYNVNSDGFFVKELSTTTSVLSEPSTLVSNSVFMRREHYESRLDATTTSIELSVTLQNRKSPKMFRTINTTFLVGKDTL